MEEVTKAVVPVMVADLDTEGQDMVPATEDLHTVHRFTRVMGAGVTDLRTGMSHITGTNPTATTTRRNPRAVAVAEARVRSGSASRMKESVRASARLSFRQALARKRFQRKRGKTASANRR